MLAEKRWQPALVLMLGALVLLSFVGGVLSALIVNRLARTHLSTNGLALLTLVITVLGFQGAALIWVDQFVRLHGVTWREAFGFARPNYGQCVFVVLLALPVAIGGEVALGKISEWFLNALHERWRWSWLKPEAQPAVELLQRQWPVHLIVLQGIVAMGLAPVAEEVLFRGVLYTTLRQRGHRLLAVGASAFLFAGIHFYPVGLLSLIFLAVLLALVYERTKNLFAPILLHSLFNAVNFSFIVGDWQWAKDLFKA